MCPPLIPVRIIQRFIAPRSGVVASFKKSETSKSTAIWIPMLRLCFALQANVSGSREDGPVRPEPVVRMVSPDGIRRTHDRSPFIPYTASKLQKDCKQCDISSAI